MGTWDCTHPAWHDTITISPDGTFARPDGDAGHWTLAGLQGHLVLVLAWDHWSPETVTMISPDEMRGEIHTETTDGEFEMHRRAQPASGTDTQEGGKRVHKTRLAILAASYSYGSQYVDVTARVRELLRTEGTFQANPGCLLSDPHPGMNKALVIFCRVKGKRAIFSVGENEAVSRELLLKNSRLVENRTEPARNVPASE